MPAVHGRYSAQPSCVKRWWQQSLKYMHHLTSVDPLQFMHKALSADLTQVLGWGQAVLAALSPMGVTMPTCGADFKSEAGCVTMATAAETALTTRTLDNNLDWVYYSFNTDSRLEPYLTQLHHGPLRTTLDVLGTDQVSWPVRHASQAKICLTRWHDGVLSSKTGSKPDAENG